MTGSIVFVIIFNLIDINRNYYQISFPEYLYNNSHWVLKIKHIKAYFGF